MTPDFVINGVVIPAGTRTRIDIPAAWLPSQTMLSMPVTVIRGTEDGPRLWVSSAVHGDEINGVEIIHRLLQFLKRKKIKGTLMAVPIVNIFGFTHQSRYLPDRRDLNRCFPGSPKGSLAGRLAHLFMKEVVSNATHGIDLHTGAVHKCNYLHLRCDPQCEESLDLAKAFQAKVGLVSKSMAGTLRKAATQKGIPNLLIEFGEALRFNREYFDECTEGVLRVMASLGMIRHESIGCKETLWSPKATWIRAKHGGLFHSETELGKMVDKGQVIGRISDVLGKFNTKVKAPKAGMLIGVTKKPLVYQGDALVHIAET